MNPKRKAPPSASPPRKSHSRNLFSHRDGLGAYILHPEKYDSTRVIFYDSDFVAIHDLYPKSSVHTLLLPRSEKHNLLHPFDAFEDPIFLASVRTQVTKLTALVAKELQRKYGPVSKQDSAREAVLNGEVELAEGEEIPQGRNWEKEVMVGIHAHPSMNHLHIHVLSRDRFSTCLKHRKHYNSFNTGFFVSMDDFPLGADDERRLTSGRNYMEEDMVCWRCGKNFQNKFSNLKDHLAEEFEEWKRE